MEKKEICFWSVGDGEHAFMLQALVDSFHAVKMEDDFYAFSDRPIAGAVTLPMEPLSELDKKIFFFKFTYLQSYLKQLPYRFFVFLDADNYFVRKPRSLQELVRNSPIHSFLESDCTLPSIRKTWHGIDLPDFVRMMRECGVTSEKVYNVNAGCYMIKSEAIDIVCGLVQDFWQYCLQNRSVITDEAALAYATHMLCEDPEQHLLAKHAEIWCTDWMGRFADRLPDGEPWIFADYMNGEPCYSVNPAIVHAVKSKKALITAGKQRKTML